MKYAIFESGGKQYKAVEGSTIEVDRLTNEAGEKIDLEHVLFVSDGKQVLVGTPTVPGAKVKATVLEEFKAPKVIIFKYHPRKRYRLKRGHRQWYTRVKIDSITTKAKTQRKKTTTTKSQSAKSSPKKVAKSEEDK
jgi:large subunit ribosomal protein L21